MCIRDSANAAGDLIELYAILAVVLGGTSLMGGKFTIAGTVIGVLIIQTLKSTILFLGVSSAQSPVFFAAVVILVVLIQSPRLHHMARGLTGGKFTIAGTVIGVLFIQTLDSTILFLGISSDQSPVFFALVVIIVVLIQSPSLHRWVRSRRGRPGGAGAPKVLSDAEVAA